jgi:hypothetical protein
MTALRISVSIGFPHLSVEQARGPIRFDWGMLCPKTSRFVRQLELRADISDYYIAEKHHFSQNPIFS